MSMAVKNNMPAVQALHTLNRNSGELAKSLAQVSSGMKINGAADDASAYAISERMRVQLRGLGQDIQNTQNATNLMKTAEGAVSSTLEILKTLKEKAIDAANDSNTDLDRMTIQKEVDQQLDQIDDNAHVTFNGKALLNGEFGNNIIASAHDCLMSFMSRLNTNTASTAAEAYDDAIKWASGGLFEDRDELEKSYLGALAASDGAAAFLMQHCGIDLHNDDTGAIIGKDAGGERVKTAESIVPENGNPYETGAFVGTINGLTITGVDLSGAGAGAEEAAAKIVKALTGQWLKNALDLVTESYGLSFRDTDTMIKSMDITFENANNGRLAAVSQSYNGAGEITSLTLIVNMNYYSNMDWSDPNGKSASQGYLDRTIAHEMTHALMAANIKNFSGLPLYVTEGTAELVHGIDDFRKSTIELLATPSNALEAEKTLNGDYDNDSAKGEYPYAVGYTIMRYMAKQSAEAAPKPHLTFQVGTKANQTIRVGLGDMRTTALGLRRADGKQVSVVSQFKANSAISTFDFAVEKALKQQTYIGAVESRMEFTAANLTTASENVQSSESTIRDADMAKEMTSYTKNNVLLQSAQSMLAQANQNSSSVLSLLQ